MMKLYSLLTNLLSKQRLVAWWSVSVSVKLTVVAVVPLSLSQMQFSILKLLALSSEW
jgi:hypothetical protein